MADLPGLPSTVDLGGVGPQVEGDPLEFMQKHAREAIDSIKKNVICNENEKVEFTGLRDHAEGCKRHRGDC